MACHLIAEAREWLEQTPSGIDWARSGAAAAAAYALVGVAEFGDKSQLVCMTLAARHRHWPVLAGAVIAFALLNVMAVVFGAVAGHWAPRPIMAIAVALLFAGFGIRNLLARGEEDQEAVKEASGHGIFVTTFLMIFLAEFGDKTQIAVAGLGAAEPPLPVWLGATAALATTSALGIWAGRTLLRRVPPRTMNIISGLLFMSFALFAASQAIPEGSLPLSLEGLSYWLKPK
ncbi:MAG: TMEM165/GDT1 family protein [Methylococcus sp.]